MPLLNTSIDAYNNDDDHVYDISYIIYKIPPSPPHLFSLLIFSVKMKEKMMTMKNISAKKKINASSHLPEAIGQLYWNGSVNHVDTLDVLSHNSIKMIMIKQQWVNMKVERKKHVRVLNNQQQHKQQQQQQNGAFWFQLIFNQLPLDGQKNYIMFIFLFFFYYYYMIRDFLGWWPGKKSIAIIFLGEDGRWKRKRRIYLIKKKKKLFLSGFTARRAMIREAFY